MVQRELCVNHVKFTGLIYRMLELLVSHGVPGTSLAKLRQKAVLGLCHYHRGAQRIHTRHTGSWFDFSSRLEAAILIFTHCFSLFPLLYI